MTIDRSPEPGHRLRPGPVVVPTAVDVSGDGLWLEAKYDSAVDPKVAPSDLAFTLARLGKSDVPARHFRDFARSNGMLGGTGAAKLFFLTQADILPSARRRREPLKMWRHFAGQARALLRVSAALYEGSPGNLEDWTAAVERTGVSRPVNLNIRDRRQVVELLLRGWDSVAGVRRRLDWSNMRQPRIEFDGDGHVLAAVASQLLFAIGSDSSVVAMCDDCGDPYVPTRAPVPGRRKFCQQCGIHGAWRSASATYRLRRRRRRRAHKGEAAHGTAR